MSQTLSAPNKTKEMFLLSDNPRAAARKSPKARPKNAVGNKFYSDRQKLEAVTTYLMLGGNIKLTAKTLSIPADTLYIWAKTEWWNSLVNDVRKEDKLQLSSRLKKIIETSWNAVGDRLEKGDWILNNKTGEVIRKPVSIRDAARVAVDASTLRDKLNTGDNFSTQSDAIEDKLAKLAKAFSDLSKGITNNQAVQDIAYIENGDASAIHDKREERL